MLPRNVSILEAYVPTILLLFIAGAMIAWIVDRALSLTGLYRVVWHPALFRASLLVCICGALGLYAYR
jgi:protein AaeX